MGKSRLLHEFVDSLPQGTWHIVRVETTARSTAIPYFLITALLRDFVGDPRMPALRKSPPACPRP